MLEIEIKTLGGAILVLMVLQLLLQKLEDAPRDRQVTFDQQVHAVLGFACEAVAGHTTWTWEVLVHQREYRGKHLEALVVAAPADG